MSEEPALPPTRHTLRPHHIDLLAVIVLTFKEFESRHLPSSFLLSIYRLLLQEISEVAQPKTHEQLVNEIQAAPHSFEPEPSSFIIAFRDVHHNFKTADHLASFIGGLLNLVDGEPSKLARRSFFGYFCRRCFFSFQKLSFSGAVQLQKDYMSWCTGDIQAGYEVIATEELDSADHLIFKTLADSKVWAQPESFQRWELGQTTGDASVANESLRRFFEQRFHEGHDSGIRQHALLNLVRMHYLRQEYKIAQLLLTEAINTSRICGDKLTLQHCISLLHRLPVQHDKPPLNEIQPNTHPFELLHDVHKLLQEHNDQPLSFAFSKLVEANSLYDHWIDNEHLTSPASEQQWAQHAVQAIVWDAAGCHQLSEIEDNMVIAFTEPGSQDNSRMTSIINRAYKKAQHGDYNDGLAMLLAPNVWQGLTSEDYITWASEVWHILVLRAIRRGQQRQYKEVLLPRKPPGTFDSWQYFTKDPSEPTTSDGDKIVEPLRQIIGMKKCNQASNAVEHLLMAIWHSEFLSRFSYYRTAVILLADVALDFGMSKRSKRLIEEIMPQIISGADREQRALACFTLARCIMISEEAPLSSAVDYLKIAEQDYSQLEMYEALMDTQYLLSVTYDNLGLTNDRNQAAARHRTTEEKQKAIEGMVEDAELRKILDLVATVGSVLAARS